MNIRRALENSATSVGLVLLTTGLFGGIISTAVGTAIIVNAGLEYFEEKNYKKKVKEKERAERKSEESDNDIYKETAEDDGEEDERDSG